MGRLRKASILFALIVFSACSNNNPSSPDADNATPPNLPDLSMLGIATPQNAPANVQAMIFAANSLTGTGLAYLNAATGTQPAQVNNQWVWKYTNNSLIITMTATAHEDSVDWQLALDGTDQASGIQFNNWTVMTGTSSSDGLQGNLIIYNINSTQIAGTASWQTDSQGTLSVNLNANFLDVQATANPNGTGSLLILQSGVKIYEATWTASSGSWTSYDATTGQQIASGTW